MGPYIVIKIRTMWYFQRHWEQHRKSFLGSFLLGLCRWYNMQNSSVQRIWNELSKFSFVTFGYNFSCLIVLSKEIKIEEKKFIKLGKTQDCLNNNVLIITDAFLLYLNRAINGLLRKYFINLLLPLPKYCC